MAIIKNCFNPGFLQLNNKIGIKNKISQLPKEKITIMKGVKYNLVFRKLDGNVINMSDLSSKELITHIPYLFKTYYDYELTCSQSFINTLNTRSHRLNKFVRDRISISRVDKLDALPTVIKTTDTQIREQTAEN